MGDYADKMDRGEDMMEHSRLRTSHMKSTPLPCPVPRRLSRRLHKMAGAKMLRHGCDRDKQE